MKYLVIGLVFIAVSCQTVQERQAPENLIPKETMTHILTDLYISNAARSINNKVIKEYQIQLDSVIYTKYQIDSLQFAESNAYYSANIKEYTQLMKVLEERLLVLKTEKDSVYLKEKEEKEAEKAKKVKEEKGILAEPAQSSSN